MPHDFGEFSRAAALALAALLPIINPVGSAPIFLSMTPGATEATRTALARRIGLNAFLLLLAAMLVGSYVLLFFGLSLAVVKIAGGLLVISTGWQLITASQGSDTTMAKAASVTWGAAEIENQNFYPLTFPLTIGPGSVSVAMTLGAGTRTPATEMLLSLAGLVVGLALVGLAIYLSYRYAFRLLNVLGHTGSVVLLRLSAFILLAVGVQIFCDGLTERFTILTR